MRVALRSLAMEPAKNDHQIVATSKELVILRWQLRELDQRTIVERLEFASPEVRQTEVALAIDLRFRQEEWNFDI